MKRKQISHDLKDTGVILQIIEEKNMWFIMIKILSSRNEIPGTVL
jgi:hypothetical protein